MALIDISGYITQARDQAAQLIDRLQAAEDAEIKQIAALLGHQVTVSMEMLSNLLKAEIDGLESIEDKAVADIGRLIDRLDGWHLEYSGTVRLSRPEEKTNG
jgi:ABC-type Fe3+-hydroxamate transport system substrate-binding protein